MKTTVQIKADLYEGQHDALIAFYNTYPRLIVSKLLLRLCEGCMPNFPPTLAQFESSPTPTDATARSVAIRLDKDEHPVFWRFYKDLPYGAKSIFIVNLMNHYAQLAEADRTLLESIFWSANANGSANPVGQTLRKPEAVGSDIQSSTVTSDVSKRTGDERTVGDKPLSPEGAGHEQKAKGGDVIDPLEGLDLAGQL